MAGMAGMAGLLPTDIPKIPGVDSTAADAAIGIAKAKAAQSAAPSGEEAGKKYVQGIFHKPIPLWAHRLLTGIFPFAAFQPLFSLIPGVGPFYQAICAMLFSVFYTLGTNGANLLLSGSMGWGAVKFGSSQMLQGLYFLLSKSYPGQWWLPHVKSFIKYANPWFTFDIIQTYSPNFSREGYKLPFVNKFLNANIAENEATRLANKLKVDQTDSNGNVILTIETDENGDPIYVTGEDAAAAAAAAAKKKKVKAPKVPPECLPKSLGPYDIGFKIPDTDEKGMPVKDEDGSPVYKEDPTTNKPQISFGHMSATLIGMMFLFIYPWYLEISSSIPPEIQPVLSSWVGSGVATIGIIMGIVTTFGVAGIYAVPGALTQLKNLFVSVNQAGGSKGRPSPPQPLPQKQSGGSTSLPDMNKVIKAALDNTRDEMPIVQDGGGAIDADESTIFLGSLTIASLIGISLAVMRNKKLSRESV